MWCDPFSEEAILSNWEEDANVAKRLRRGGRKRTHAGKSHAAAASPLRPTAPVYHVNGVMRKPKSFRLKYAVASFLQGYGPDPWCRGSAQG